MKAVGKSANDEHQQDLEGQTNMVVATLMATIAFAAAFQLPGGYTSTGAATLATKTSFRIFIVCNNLTMLLSCFSLLSYFLFITFIAQLGVSTRIKTNSSLYKIPSVCTLFAVPTMMGAFVAGTYAVLSELPKLAVPVCILGCSFFLFSFILLQGVVPKRHRLFTG
ncbi:hypothetical protein MKW94_010316 [Papaver nudicaule]|uniref:PGG domain-containing protein n=1 Tax=Papaver nudicaule TaxID=74823 RepID=A0AA41VJF2_PAPNU|nr:hypothetical protein [Papaver nudicaule]